MEKLVVTLFKEIREDITIEIYARITEKGELMVEGVDSGVLVEKLKGDRDYEYYLKVDEVHKKLLIENLEIENIQAFDDKALLSWIKSNYSGNNAFSSFKAFLEAEKIEFQTYFWI